MDHILSRLATEQSSARNRLVQLLFDSFMPLDKPPDVQLQRCIYLLRSNSGAARNFYLQAYRHMDLPAICKQTLEYLLSREGRIGREIIISYLLKQLKLILAIRSCLH